MHKLKLNLDANGFGDVTLDGIPLDVFSLVFIQKAGESSMVTLTIKAEVEGEVEVRTLAPVVRKPLNEVANDLRAAAEKFRALAGA
jgi:hypothetical protein